MGDDAMTQEDDELAAYRARLKKTSFRPSGTLVLAFLMPVLAIGTFFVYRHFNDPDASETSAGSLPPRPPTEAELTARALQSVADTWAPVEPSTLEAGEVADAKGRKVLFVEQSMDLDPHSAALLQTPRRLERHAVRLPDDLSAASSGPFATKPAEVGVVVLLRARMIESGTYSGGSEPAHDIEYDGEAILVPERKHVAQVHHLVPAPATAMRLGSGTLVGGISHDDGAWLGDVATALADGRAPQRR